VQSLRTGARTVLVTGGYFGRYVHGEDPSTGHLLYMHGDVLFAAPMDAVRLALTGPSSPVLEDVAGRGANGLAHFAFTPSGTLLYLAGAHETYSSVYWLDASGIPEVLSLPQGGYLSPRVSPDGSRIAIQISGASGVTVGIYDWAQGRMTRLTALKEVGSQVVWAPDGQHIVVALNAPGGPGIYWVRADGASDPQRIVDGSNLQPSSLSDDGKRLVYDVANAPQPSIWTAEVDLADPEHPKTGKLERFLIF